MPSRILMLVCMQFGVTAAREFLGGRSSLCDATSLQALNTSLDGRLFLLRSANRHQLPISSPADPAYYWNLGMLTELPTYVVQPKNYMEIQEVLAFANVCNMTVNTKVHGHSYQGASAARADFVLAMDGFSDNDIEVDHGNFIDSCGTSWSASVNVAGGVDWLSVYKAIGPNYTVVGGTCDTVSAVGGWLLSNGLGLQQQRSFGLGIDNVLEFEVILANGSLVKADACTNPALFKTLRGGGGGFGIVISARYALHPNRPIQEFRIGYKKTLYNTTTDKFWDLVIKHSFVEDRWVMWPAQHMNLDEFGANEHFIIWLYFNGDIADAESSDIYKDFKEWMLEAPREAQVFHHSSYRTFQEYKLHNYINSSSMSGIRNYKSPGVDGNFPYHGNRLIPGEFLRTEPLKARKMFQSLEGKTCDNFYHMGGAIYDLAKSGYVDAVENPAIRESVWQIGLCDLQALNELRAMFPNNVSGTGHNHVGWNEPDWQESIWGKEKYAFLLESKARYDPQGRFKCRFCVGS